MAKDWPFPQDSKTDTSGYMEHRSGRSGGKAPDSSGMTDNELAEALEISVREAHDRIDDVREARAVDLGEDDA